MSILFTRLIEQLIYPPTSALLAVIMGLWLLRKRPRLGRSLIAAGALLLYVSSIPLTNLVLSSLLERTPPLSLERIESEGPQALVVLGGGRYPNAPEYGGSTSGPSEVERLRYCARIQRDTQLPIAVIGGDAYDTGVAEADLMADVLQNEFQVPVRWRDGRSRNTFDNAQFAWQLLQQQGIERIVLVTHAWHMPRAERVFRDVGFKVTPGPTAFTTLGKSDSGPFLFIPKAAALYRTHRALHELVGIVWYWIFY